MKTLVLLRHGKAEASGSHRTDADRALHARGIQEAEAIGAYLDQNKLTIDLVLCSTAHRTRLTFEHLGGQSVNKAEVVFDPDLYLASVEQLFRTVQGVNEKAEVVLIVGHNPGLHEFAFSLNRDTDTHESLRLMKQFPPGSLAILGFEVDTWFEVLPKSGRLRSFVIPKIDLLTG